MLDKTANPATEEEPGIATGAEEPLTAAGEEEEPDAVTGASPGTAQACTDLGLNSLQSNLDRFGIMPPGQS